MTPDYLFLIIFTIIAFSIPFAFTVWVKQQRSGTDEILNKNPWEDFPMWRTITTTTYTKKKLKKRYPSSKSYHDN